MEEEKAYYKPSLVEREVYFGSDPVVGESHYLGPLEEVEPGDILWRDDEHKCWHRGSNLNDEDQNYVSSDKRSVIESILGNLETGDEATVNLKGGATLSCSIGSGDTFDISELPSKPEPFVGTLKLDVAVQAAEAFDIQTRGQWECIAHAELEKEINSGSFNLSKLWDGKATDTFHAVVVGVFRTTGPYTSFTNGDANLQVEFENNNADLDDIYGRLKAEIRTKSPNIVFDGSVEPVVPFVRLIPLEPIWKEKTDLRAIGDTKPLPPAVKAPPVMVKPNPR